MSDPLQKPAQMARLASFNLPASYSVAAWFVLFETVSRRMCTSWDGQNVATASGPASVATTPGASAVFLDTDAATQGNWQSVYGKDGYNIIQDALSYPSYATVSETGTSNNTRCTTTPPMFARWSKRLLAE
jgi:hypothetical protein